MIPIDRGGEGVPHNYQKVNTIPKWEFGTAETPPPPRSLSRRRPLQRADVLDNRLSPAVDVRPLAVANAVLVAGHVDHVTFTLRPRHGVVRLLVSDRDQAIAAVLLI